MLDDAAADPILRAFDLGHVRLRNRIMTTAHEPAYTEDGLPKARYRAYHERRARAGVALAMTAGSAVVSRDSPPSFGNVEAWRDEVVPWMRELSDALHAHGTAVMIQLTHLGRRTGWDRGDWLPSVSSTREPEPAHRYAAKLIEDHDVERITRDYADAAERMQAAGLDGIEVEAYGHLPDQFWSPLTNQLDQDTLSERMAFSMGVLRAIRERVGPRFVVSVRFTADEAVPGGLTEADGLEVARRLEASGLVDVLNVVRGFIATDPGLTDAIPVGGMPSAPHLDFAGRVKAAVSLPVIHAARIPDVATARHAIAAGLLDLVGMTRAHMAEPDIVALVREGREDDIRPCVGANHCLDRIYRGGEALCIHNAATGRELTMPHVIAPAERRRRVVVVGAGPAGLEAARVAGERGHAVTVLEAASEPGGQVRLLARDPRRREMLGIVDWRMRRCEAAGVEFRWDHYAEAGDVEALGPDVAIVATGGAPPEGAQTGLEEGAELTVSAWDVLSGAAKPTGDVLVYDGAGDHPAMQAAHACVRAGARVEVVTPDRSFAPEVMAMNLVPYVRALQVADATFTVTWRLKGVRREGNRLLAMLGTDYSDLRRTRPCDQVVLSLPPVPADDLYLALKPRSANRGATHLDALLAGRPQPERPGMTLHRIGDAVSARSIHAAVHDALRLAKDL